MCGIVGIVGRDAVAGQVVEALRRLEYRGYDSAGIATLERGELHRRRASGKLANLEAKLVEQPLTGRSASAIPAGPRMEGPPRPTPTRTPPHASPSSITASSRIFAN